MLILGLFSRYDVENTQVKLIIHVWYAWLTSWLPHKSHMANNVIFKFKVLFYDICVGLWLANTIWWWAKAHNFIWIYNIFDTF